MAKETRETEIVISGKDQYSPTADKVDRRIDGTAAKIKTLGKLGGFSGLGSVANVVEGFQDTGLGTVGKTAGALAAVEIGGRTLKALGDGARQTYADVQSGAKGVGQAIDENIINKLPVLGTAKQGLEAVFGDAGSYATGIGGIGKAVTRLGEAWDQVTGKAAAAAAAMKIGEKEVAVKGRLAVDKSYDDSIAGFIQQTESPEVKIARERDEALERLRQQRNEREAKNGILTGDRLKQYGDAQAAIRQDAENKLKAIQDKAAADRQAAQDKIDDARIARAKETEDRITRIQADTIQASTDVIVDGLRRQGKEYDADIAEIEAKYKSQRDALNAERQRIIDNPSDPATDAKARAAIAAREAAISNAEGGDVAAAKGREVSRREAAAEKIRQITRETIGMQVAADDQEGQKALKRIDILQHAADLEKQINDELKDQSLTAEQRAALEAQRAGLKLGVGQQLDAIDRRPDQVVQGRGFASAVDARFNGESIAARAQVEVFRDQAKSAAAMAENTKAILAILQGQAQLPPGRGVGA